MTKGNGYRLALLAGVVLATLPAAGGALAQDADPGDAQRMNSIEGQIKGLQDELRAMRREQAARDRQLKAAQQDAAQAREEAQRAQAAAAAAPPTQVQLGQPGQAGLLGQPAPGQAGFGIQTGPNGIPGYRNYGNENAGQQNAAVIQGPGKGSFQVGGVTVTLGGFIESAGFFRSRNEVADVGSSFSSGIPEPQSPLYHENEWRQSARQSRIAMLIQGDVDEHQKLAMYIETDFLGTGPSGNSNESNSYNLRLRQAYATYDNTNWGFHFLGGQSWSMLTLFKQGIIPRQEDVPYTIDAQYVAGFDWARQAQFRFVGSALHDKLWYGISFEEPQSVFYTGPNGLAPSTIGTVNVANPGGSLLNSTTSYSNDIAPDTVVKVAADPGWGHYEVYGLLKFIDSRVSHVGDGNNHTTPAGGGGAALRVPVLPNVYLRASVLAGYGIGRYGSAQLSDAVLRPDGSPQPLPEVEAMAGIESTFHKSLDLYAYVGTEQLGRESFVSKGKAYGYGNPLFVNSGCGVELSSLACAANTSGVVDGTLGFWYRPLVGPYGTVQFGAEYEYLRRSIFSGVGGSKGTDDNIALISFRYLPFQ
jgi:outer membrane murein-binding lipoprotein Lpp